MNFCGHFFFYLNWFLEITLCNATFQGYINMIKTETSVSQIKPQKIIFIFIRIVFILQNGTRFVQNLLVWSFKQKATCIFTFLLAVYLKIDLTIFEVFYCKLYFLCVYLLVHVNESKKNIYQKKKIGLKMHPAFECTFQCTEMHTYICYPLP